MIFDITSRCEKMRVGDYIITDTRLGVGRMSVVLKCTHEKTNKDYAMKLIIGESVDLGITEFDVLKQFSHPNCISCVEAFFITSSKFEEKLKIKVDRKHSPEKVLALIFPLADACLYDISQSDWNLLPQYTKISLFMDICYAVDHIHSKGYYHGDIHPKNILIFADKRKLCGLSATLADFNLAARVEDVDNYGSFPFESPMSFLKNGHFNLPPDIAKDFKYETVLGESKFAVDLLNIHSKGVEDPKSADIFSMGLLLSYLLSKDMKNFLQTNNSKIDVGDVRHNMTKYIVFPELFLSLTPDPIPEQFVDVVYDCCKINPSERYTIQELIIAMNISTSVV